jgi:uncharacterized protein YkwD
MKKNRMIAAKSIVSFSSSPFKASSNKTGGHHERSSSHGSISIGTAMTSDSTYLDPDDEISSVIMVTPLHTSMSFDEEEEEPLHHDVTKITNFQLIRQPSCRNLFSNLDCIDSDDDDEEDDEEEQIRDQEEEENSITATSDAEWKSSGSTDHHENSPLIVLRSQAQRYIDPINHPELELSDEEVLQRVLTKAAKSLPRSAGNFASLHVLINNERIKHQIAPLQRSVTLDEAARQHAKRMADRQSLHHPNLDGKEDDTDNEFFNVLKQDNVERVGSNVCYCTDGDLVHMHQCIMNKNTDNTADRNNILDRRYTEMGIGTYKSLQDGKLYVCELFLQNKI